MVGGVMILWNLKLMTIGTGIEMRGCKLIV